MTYTLRTSNLALDDLEDLRLLRLAAYSTRDHLIRYGMPSDADRVLSVTIDLCYGRGNQVFDRIVDHAAESAGVTLWTEENNEKKLVDLVKNIRGLSKDTTQKTLNRIRWAQFCENMYTSVESACFPEENQ